MFANVKKDIIITFLAAIRRPHKIMERHVISVNRLLVQITIILSLIICQLKEMDM